MDVKEYRIDKDTPTFLEELWELLVKHDAMILARNKNYDPIDEETYLENFDLVIIKGFTNVCEQDELYMEGVCGIDHISLKKYTHRF